MERNNFFKCLILLVVFCVCGLLPAKTASAANPTTVTLKINKTYTGYDVTGDKKKDKIMIKPGGYSYGTYKSLAVYVNGKKQTLVGNNLFFYSTSIKLYTLSNGKPFLYIDAYGDNGDGHICGIFQYKMGKWKRVLDFTTFFRPYGGHLTGKVVSVNGKNIKVRFYVMSWALGPTTIDYIYSYKDGTLKRTSTYGKYHEIYSYGKKTRKFTVNKTITAYKAADGKTKAFVLKRRNTVTVTKCRFINGKMYIQLKYKGKTGWIKAQNKYLREDQKQFSNATYAG